MLGKKSLLQIGEGFPRFKKMRIVLQSMLEGKADPEAVVVGKALFKALHRQPFGDQEHVPVAQLDFLSIDAEVALSLKLQIEGPVFQFLHHWLQSLGSPMLAKRIDTWNKHVIAVYTET